MIGHIESYDADTQTGVIKSEDKFFAFHVDDWLAQGVPPEQGDDVSFEGDESSAKNVDLVGAYLEKPKAVKYKYLAVLLGLLLGYVGAHRFYLGHYKIAIAQIAVTLLTVGYGALWGFIEAVLIFSGHINTDAKGRPLK
ncbi:MAG: TM2 domain-containing protein [Methylovulum sp.]|nr:TM2 domain-containing protein [Methylovulum sp.]